MVQRVQTPHTGRVLPLLLVLCTFAVILAITTSSIFAIGLADGQTIPNKGTRIQSIKNLKVYDSEFFSIKYPSSWHISSEEGSADIPGASGVTFLENQMVMNQSNRKTPHSNMGHSVLSVTVVPRSSLPGSISLNASGLVDSFMDYSFSSEKLKYIGAQLLADNYTSLSGIPARSIFYTKDGYFNMLANSADLDNMYQIGYRGQISKYERELPEVASVIDSFEIKKPKVSIVESTTDIDTIKVPFSIYSNPNYGIKLMYPRGWDVQEEVMGMVTFTNPSNSSVEFPDATFAIGGITFTKGKPHFENFSAKQFKDFMTQSFSLLNKYQINIPEIQLIDAVKTTTDKGYPEFRLQSLIKVTDPDDPTIIYQQKRLQIWIPRASNIYILEYDSGPSKFAIFLPVVEKMVNSFEITNETKNLSLYSPKSPISQALKNKLAEENSKIYVARSGSMEPFFYPDDMLLISNSTTFDDLRIGDVIVFKKPSDISISIIARIIDIQTDTGSERIITTKGDANPSPIPGTDFPIKKDNYIGKVISVITRVQK